MEVRRAELQRRVDKTAKSAQTALRKAQRVADAAVLETALAQLTTGQIVPKIDQLLQCECYNDCTVIQAREISLVNDGWRGSPVEGCTRFYCAKVNCQKKLSSHMKLCLQRRR